VWRDKDTVPLVVNFGSQYSVALLGRDRMCLIAPVGPGVRPVPPGPADRIPVSSFERIRV
jgi:hypothetical protein